MPTAHPYRRRSRPATLLTRIPGFAQQRPADVEDSEVQEEGTEENIAQNGNGISHAGPSEPTEEEVESGNNSDSDWDTNHLTRLGVPDRRFLENRALTEDDIGLNYRRASTGRVVNGVHVTEDGAPDRRFKENRSLSDDDVELMKAELILSKHGVSREEISPTEILARHASSDSIPTQPRMPATHAATISGTRKKVASRASTQSQKATGTGGARRR